MSLNFLRKRRSVSPRGWDQHFPHSTPQGPALPRPPQLCQPQPSAILLTVSGVADLFMCLFAASVSYVVECLFQSFKNSVVRLVSARF